MRITVLQKPGRLSAEDFERTLGAAISFSKGELSASARLQGFSKKGWAIIDVQGDDGEILSELLVRELFRAQTSIDNVELHGNYDGIVSRTGEDGLEVDLGVEDPKSLNAKIDVSSLRVQLTNGKPTSGGEIVDNYCLFPGIKLKVRITRVDRQAGKLEACLADSQMEQFHDWIGLGLDRIQVFECSPQQLELAVRRTNLERDIISSDKITLSVQSALCKLGTDAIGLMPKLGSFLRSAQLKPFLPRRIVARFPRW